MFCTKVSQMCKSSVLGDFNKIITNMTLHSPNKTVYTSTLTTAFLIHKSVEETRIL